MKLCFFFPLKISCSSVIVKLLSKKGQNQNSSCLLCWKLVTIYSAEYISLAMRIGDKGPLNVFCLVFVSDGTDVDIFP